MENSRASRYREMRQLQVYKFSHGSKPVCKSKTDLIVLPTPDEFRAGDHQHEREEDPQTPERKMAKFVIFVASALCFASLVSFASADADDFDQFHISGSVYCDTCRVQFVTRLSKFLEGAKVKLECKSRENGTLVLSKEAVTDKSGTYYMDVMGDHENEVCEVVLAESPDADCSEVNNEEYIRNAAKVSLTANDGIVSNETRIVNALGFMMKTPLSDCPKALKELGVVPDVIF